MSLLSGRYVRSLLSHVLWIYLCISCILLTGFYHFSHVYFSSGLSTLLLLSLVCLSLSLSLSPTLWGHNCQMNISQSLYRYFSIQKIWMVVKNMFFVVVEYRCCYVALINVSNWLFQWNEHKYNKTFTLFWSSIIWNTNYSLHIDAEEMLCLLSISICFVSIQIAPFK